ncbi:MAG: hypothetical protein KF795_03300 [Labilithrix sp.]|nr:hypothetical protein [Labilithrix sp.]
MRQARFSHGRRKRVLEVGFWVFFWVFFWVLFWVRFRDVIRVVGRGCGIELGRGSRRRAAARPGRDPLAQR